MTRVHGAHAGRRQQRSLSARTNHKKPQWKSVFESVTQQKKQLRYIASYNEEPPAHYQFVPIGNLDLTRRCKEKCQEADLLFQTVSTTPKSKAHLDPDKVSHHIHRIGNHFPTDVVEEACRWLGLEHYGHGLFRPSHAMAQRPAARKNKEDKEQIKRTIQELFPKIPAKDLKSIANHAWKKGSDRVGNSDMPLTRRVQLAVSAFVRHKYTNYDALWKQAGYYPARSMVEQQTLDRLKSWRGEDPNKVETEEVLREYIVIDSDDDGDAGEESSWSSEESPISIVSAPPHHTASRPHTAQRAVDFPRTQYVPDAQHTSLYPSHHQRTGYERQHGEVLYRVPERYPVGVSQLHGRYYTDDPHAPPVYRDRVTLGRYSAAGLSAHPEYRSGLPQTEGTHVAARPTWERRQDDRHAEVLTRLVEPHERPRHRDQERQIEPERIYRRDPSLARTRPLAPSPDIPILSVEHDSPHRPESSAPRLALGYDRNGQTIVVSSNADAADRYHDVDHNVARGHESQPLSKKRKSWPEPDYAYHPRTMQYHEQPARIFTEADRRPTARGPEVIDLSQDPLPEQNLVRRDHNQVDSGMTYHHHVPRTEWHPLRQEVQADQGRSRNVDAQYVVAQRQPVYVVYR